MFDNDIKLDGHIEQRGETLSRLTRKWLLIACESDDQQKIFDDRKARIFWCKKNYVTAVIGHAPVGWLLGVHCLLLSYLSERYEKFFDRRSHENASDGVHSTPSSGMYLNTTDALYVMRM